MAQHDTSFARIDRQVAENVQGIEVGRRSRLSELVAVDRLILLGEPGAGKSTAFRQMAADLGVAVVSARAFVEGQRPAGRAVFIDALEEYRIGEPARERLADLSAALKGATYTQWRIACRAVSLPPPEAHFLATELGAYESWHLEGLSRPEARDILSHLGEPDPHGFLDRVQALGAIGLIGNPATLKLLRETILKPGAGISTRGALLTAASENMAHEHDPLAAEDPDRPLASAPSKMRA